MRPEGNFSVGLSNALLEAKHYRAMGDALWLYTYLLDRQGRRVDANGFGKVAGGMPIRDSDIAGTFGSSGRTISRWRSRLRLRGYITTRRTPYGYCYAITKPKKWKKTTGSDVTQPAHLSEGDVTQPVKRCDTTCTNKEEIQRVTVVAATAVSESQMEKELQTAWDHYLDAFKKDEIISPSARRIGRVVLTRLREKHPAILSEQCVDAMTGAIDRACHLVKSQPKKAFFSDWFAIFGNFDTFYSLWEEA
jgi:hypothetical protein